jgi:hypothetical protein
MAKILPLRPRKRPPIFWKVLFVLSAVAVAALAWGAMYYSGTAPIVNATIERVSKTVSTNIPSVGRQYMVPPVQNIQVVDGDTVRVDGKSYRLVGFDTRRLMENAKRSENWRHAPQTSLEKSWLQAMSNSRASHALARPEPKAPTSATSAAYVACCCGMAATWGRL